jgi:hypothetical protein
MVIDRPQLLFIMFGIAQRCVVLIFDAGGGR